MEKYGFVVGLEGNQALVDVIRPGECGDKCNGCAGACEVKSMTVRVTNTQEAHIGDRVELSLAPVHFVQYTFMLYTVPLFAFIIGVFGGYSLQPVLGWLNRDAFSLMLGFVMMLVTYALISFWAKFQSQSKGMALQIKNVYKKENML